MAVRVKDREALNTKMILKLFLPASYLYEQ